VQNEWVFGVCVQSIFVILAFFARRISEFPLKLPKPKSLWTQKLEN